MGHDRAKFASVPVRARRVVGESYRPWIRDQLARRTAGQPSAAGPASPRDACADIKSYLPSECALDSCDFLGYYGVNVSCTIDLWGHDTIHLRVSLNLCDTHKGATAAFDVSEDELGFEYSDEVSLKDREDIPIPGLSIDLDVVDAGVDIVIGGQVQ